MKILLFGKNGQIGRELQCTLSFIGNLTSTDTYSKDLCGDLTNIDGIKKTINKVKPDIIVNAAAFTSVEKAETNISLSKKINEESVYILSKEISKYNGIIVHYSSDYVFDGSGDHFHTEDEKTNPINVYGKTKRNGDFFILKNNCNCLIFRTSWVFSNRKNNFIKKIINSLKENKKIFVVNDQYGSPTSAKMLAYYTSIALLNVIKNKKKIWGIYNVVPNGVTNWYSYAKYILYILKFFKKSFYYKKIIAIKTSNYLSKVSRPLNSRLSNKKFQKTFNVIFPHWSKEVKRVVKEIIKKDIN